MSLEMPKEEPEEGLNSLETLGALTIVAMVIFVVWSGATVFINSYRMDYERHVQWEHVNREANLEYQLRQERLENDILRIELGKEKN